MSAAIALAARGLGATWPNPSVGCVIEAPDGRIVGRGRTATGGRPHAEVVALAAAGAAARGATAYVTLEPCSHHGQTPPCVDALIAAGVTRVVVATVDPDPRVNGAGLARLRAAGIEVHTGLMATEAHDTLAGFFNRVLHGRPLVTLKLASTLDGRIATLSGESRWITGPAARKAVHMLRAQHDAVMTGIGTVLADDPDLTCRIPGFAHRPIVRIIADSNLRTPPTARLIATARETPTWLLHETENPQAAQQLERAGAICIQVQGRGMSDIKYGSAWVGEGQGGSTKGIDLHAALTVLGNCGLTRILIEGGAELAASLIRSDLIDRIVWFHAPSLIGSDGKPAILPLGVERVGQMKAFARVRGPIPVGDDVMTEFARTA
jgi:diaminohydroxyphosphoribosylaminopyrimidine deaminase/5-amino-6-(5-phosphoribosylamino)uracil reductase